MLLLSLYLLQYEMNYSELLPYGQFCMVPKPMLLTSHDDAVQLIIKMIKTTIYKAQ